MEMIIFHVNDIRFNLTKILSKHIFYKTIYEADRECFNKLCSNAIFEETVDKGHEVFETGEEGAMSCDVCCDFPSLTHV